MNKYKTEDHQNMAVWARRAGVEIADLDIALAYTEKHFGVGRKASLRYVLERSFRSAELGPLEARFVACVAADIVYNSAYKNAALVTTTAEFEKLLLQYKLNSVQNGACMLYAEQGLAIAKELLARRHGEQIRNGQSLTGMLLAQVRGRR